MSKVSKLAKLEFKNWPSFYEKMGLRWPGFKLYSLPVVQGEEDLEKGGLC